MSDEQLQFTVENKRYGLWFLGTFLHWNRTLRKSVILLARSQRRIEKGLEFLTWIIVFLGWFSFAFWIYVHQTELLVHPSKLLAFWSEFDPLILLFLLSLWFDLFLVYKRRARKLAEKRINYQWFNKKKKKKKLFEVSKTYSDEMIKVIEDAFLLANSLKQSEVRVIHLFRALLKNREVQNVFIRLNVDAKKLVELLDKHLLEDKKSFRYYSRLSETVQRILIFSLIDALENQQDSVEPLNVLSFCYKQDSILGEILYDLGIEHDKIINTVEWFRINKRLLKEYKRTRKLALLKPGSGMNRAYTAIATPNLNKISHDLTVKAKLGALGICVGRKKELKSIFESFSSGHNGVLLVGHPGVGKSTIINGLAQLMVQEDVPKFLKDKRLVELDVSRLISGASPAEAEERLLTCIAELNRSSNIILYIDNVENIIGVSAGSAESLDLSEVLAEAISRHHLFCLASATSDNYAHYIEGKALGSVMNVVKVKEPEKNEAIQIIESKVGQYEHQYGIYIVYNAIEEAVNMSSKYLHDKFLPLKAINLLEKAAIITSQRAANNPENNFCDREQIAMAISELTGIPVTKVTSSEREKLLNLEEKIHERMIGQEEAVDAVAASLRRARAELKSDNRPIASFLFLGPTGVGKTELAKSLAEVYFNDEKYMIRLDMSEYQQPDSVSKMIGDPDGALGYLTEAVRKQPFALILLDEIEKAHPDILNLFLQLLDDGRLTDGQGKTISFTETIIIATSNIGAVYIQDEIKKGTELAIIKQGLIDNYLNQHLRPELINRFDGITVFKTLSEDNISAIAKLMLNKIAKTLDEKGIKFEVSDAGAKVLAHEGYDPKFGARPLRRLLQDRVENEIANLILAKKLKRRDTVVINDNGNVEVKLGSKL